MERAVRLVFGFSLLMARDEERPAGAWNPAAGREFPTKTDGPIATDDERLAEGSVTDRIAVAAKISQNIPQIMQRRWNVNIFNILTWTTGSKIHLAIK
jgi:hypothetical protein